MRQRNSGLLPRLFTIFIASATALALLPSAARSQPAAPDATDAPALSVAPESAATVHDWLAQESVQARLASGNIVSRSELDGAHSRARIDAAIRINAAPAVVWKLLTGCSSASIYIPGLKHCRVLDRAADGSWEVIEHDIKYAALLPMVRSVFRADYQPLQRIDFHRVSGDMKDEQGTWLLEPSGDHAVTLEYSVAIQPGFWVPHSFVRRSLSKQLPAALLSLRTHAESLTGSSPLAAAGASEPDKTSVPGNSAD